MSPMLPPQPTRLRLPNPPHDSLNVGLRILIPEPSAPAQLGSCCLAPPPRDPAELDADRSVPNFVRRAQLAISWEHNQNENFGSPVASA